jgi:hypothetical protein
VLSPTKAEHALGTDRGQDDGHRDFQEYVVSSRCGERPRISDILTYAAHACRESEHQNLAQRGGVVTVASQLLEHRNQV